MIVLNDRPGQLCNRIWSIAPFVAFALNHRTRLLIPFFGEYAGEFPSLGGLPKINFVRTARPTYLKIVRRLFRLLRSLPDGLRRFLRISISERWGYENWDEATLAAPFSMTFLSGWTHPVPITDLRPWRNDFRSILRPSEEVCAKAQTTLERARETATNIVGIHLRRADYRGWLGGRYCFSNAQYVAIMHGIRSQLAGKTVFLLCSNERIDFEEFAELDVLTLLDATGIEDLFALSLCDLIAGPPSTYSMWASFYGDVPLYIVENVDRPIEIIDFNPIIALNRFADGREFQLPTAAGDNVEAWFHAE